MYCVCSGYQAEDVDMVTVSSLASCTDTDAVPLYPADVSVTTSSVAGSAGDSGITSDTVPVTDIQPSLPLPHTDLCDNVPSQPGMTELPEFEDHNTENGE